MHISNLFTQIVTVSLYNRNSLVSVSLYRLVLGLNEGLPEFFWPHHDEAVVSNQLPSSSEPEPHSRVPRSMSKQCNTHITIAIEHHYPGGMAISGQ